MVSHLVKVAQKLPAQGPLPNNENVQSKFIQSAFTRSEASAVSDENCQ